MLVTAVSETVVVRSMFVFSVSLRLVLSLGIRIPPRIPIKVLIS